MITGGAFASGSSSIFADYNPTTSGIGALVNGSGTNNTYDETGSGGAVAVGGEFNIYDEIMTGGAFGTGWSVQKLVESHWGWKCYALGKYIPGMVAKPDRRNSRRGALVPGITVCDQGIYYKLLKEGDKLARYEPNR